TWEDFHQNFITRAQEALTRAVGPNYLVKVEARLYLHELSGEERRFFGKGDLALTAPSKQPAVQAAGVVSAPVQLNLPNVETERHSWIEIRARRNRRVVTVMELLSPTNKTPAADRDEYLAKRA